MNLSLYLILLPGILAFVIILFATFLIERCKPVIGRIIVAIPHLVLLNTIFIMMNSPDHETIKETLFTIPTGIVAEGLFILSWKYMPKIITFGHLKFRIFIYTISSFIFWCIAPLAFDIAFKLRNNNTSDRDKIITYIGICCAVLTFFFGLVMSFNESKTQNINKFNRNIEESDDSLTSFNERTMVNWKIYIARGIAGMITSILCNYLAWKGLGIAAGFMIVFPALFTVTMISLWFVYGSELPTKSIGALLLGMTSTNIFALISGWLYLFEDWQGAAALSVAWGAAVIFGTIPMLGWMKYVKQRSKQREENESNIIFIENQKQLQFLQGPMLLNRISTLDFFNMDEDLDEN